MTSMTRLYFTKDNIWTGGFYELAIEVGSRSDEQISAVLRAIWTHPDLEGCYLDRSKEPYEQQKITSAQASLESDVHLLGLALVPNGNRIACGTCNIREFNGPDWVVFYVPMGALGEAYDVDGFPFSREVESSEQWQKSIDDWLMEIGSYVYSISQYRLGIIGFEVSGQDHSGRLAQMGIPEERYFGYLWPLEEEIKYYPRNK
jgi:hypothetical protein